MEYLEGSSLQVILRDRGQIPVDETVRMLTPLAEALDYAHRSGIVHRDIKPGNVFVLADGRPKLMDSGCGAPRIVFHDRAGPLLRLSRRTWPRSRCRGARSRPPPTCLSLGVVAYEMLTGHRPFEGASITAIMYRVVNEDAPAPRQWDFDLPPGLRRHLQARARQESCRALRRRGGPGAGAREARVRALVRGGARAPGGDAESGRGAGAGRGPPAPGVSLPVPPELLASLGDDRPAGGAGPRSRARTPSAGAVGSGWPERAWPRASSRCMSRADPRRNPLRHCRHVPGGLRIETDPPGGRCHPGR
jgi:serine/threonine-protein kinase